MVGDGAYPPMPRPIPPPPRPPPSRPVSPSQAVKTVHMEPPAEYVSHLYECPALNGGGDEACTCGAVEFLRLVEQSLGPTTKEASVASPDLKSIAERSRGLAEEFKAAAEQFRDACVGLAAARAKTAARARTSYRRMALGWFLLGVGVGLLAKVFS